MPARRHPSRLASHARALSIALGLVLLSLAVPGVIAARHASKMLGDTK